MRALPFSLSVALLVSACSGSSPTVVGGNLTLKASATSAAADGVTTIVVHVEGTGTGPFTVTTTLGTFDDGSRLLTQNSLPFDVTLHSCNSAQDATCAGSATVRATDAKGITGAVTVLFTTGGTSNTGTISVSASPTTPVVADGTTTVVVHVVGTATGEITLTTTKGVFDNGTTTTKSSTLPFDATLHSCDGAVTASCIGAATLLAADTTGASGSTVVTFTSANSNPGTVTLGQIGLVSQQYSVQGVRYSGFQEVNVLTFQALDTSGKSYPQGLTVTFTHQSLGGSFVGNSPQCTTTVPSTCTASGTTDSTGKVTVALVSGTVAGVVGVNATATADSITVNTSSRSVAVIGAKASGAHVFLTCTPKNIPAMAAPHTCLTTFAKGATGTVACTAYFGDRFANVLGVGVTATFMSEAGSAGPPVTTATFDPTVTTDQTSTLGFATDTILLTGGPLPIDVDPAPNEPFAVVVNDPCGNGATSTRTRNPRDGLATVVVMARGEEGFIDLDGNGKYDLGEPFIDSGEPFIDANDNGVWDSGEQFVDLNGDHQYNGPNGEWDSDTTIWAEDRILYTGLPSFGPGSGTDPAASFLDPPTVQLAAINLPGSQALVDFTFRDENLNPLAPTFTDFAVTSWSTLLGATFKQAVSTVDGLGLVMNEQYCKEKAPDPAQTCSNVCQWAPCYHRTRITGFSAGSVGTVWLNSNFNETTYSSILVTVEASVNKTAQDLAMEVKPLTNVVTGGSSTVGQITLFSQQYDVQGIRNSGYQEVNLLTFSVLDSAGAPFPDQTVTFQHQSLGGSFIGVTANCTTAVPSICSASGKTDQFGRVTVPLFSGTVAGTVSVRADASAGGVSVSATAGRIAIVGARASGSNISVRCNYASIPAMTAPRTCVTTYFPIDLKCTAYFSDRYSNVLGVPVAATFMSEAGRPGPAAMTAAYDPTKGPDQAATLGVATGTIVVAGGPLPVDVDPVGTEPSVVVTPDPCGTDATSSRTRNPRDGLATIIVLAQGEEGFTDLNGNGIYDPGEPFIDLGEPFVDANDNGKWDAGEDFVDLNLNHQYDGPNNQWDASTTIWAETRVMYTGWPTTGTFTPTPVTVKSSATAGTPTRVTPTFVLYDDNLNPLSSAWTTYTVAPLYNKATTGFVSRPPTLDGLGIALRQQYCQEAPGTAPVHCSSVCSWAPCYVRTSVGNTWGPSSGVVYVVGGTNPGDDLVQLSLTIQTPDGSNSYTGAVSPVLSLPVTIQ